MITGTLRSSVDKLWEAFWTGGVSNPLTVIEQITCLLFLRRLDDIQTLKEKQSAKLGHADLRADQIRFIDLIIQHLSVNGVIDKRMLAEPPFTEVHDQGIFGVFEDGDTDRIISIVERVNGNAAVV